MKTGSDIFSLIKKFSIQWHVLTVMKIILASILIFLGFYARVFMANGDLRYDSSMRAAYRACNLVRYGVYSYSPDDTLDPDNPDSTLPLTFKRGPGFPLYLAIWTRLNPLFDFKNNKTNVQLLKPADDKHREKIQRSFFRASAFAFFMAALFAGLFLFKRLNFTAAIVGFALIVYSSTFHQYTSSYRLWNEPFTALLVLLSGISIYYAVRKQHLVWFALAGIILGWLSLAVVVFQYYIVFVLGLFVWAFLKKQMPQKRFLYGSLLVLIFYSSIVGGWCARNYVNFGFWGVSQRGGQVLCVRKLFDEHCPVSGRQYLAAYIHWLLPDYKDELGLRLLGSKEETERLYTIFNRRNNSGMRIKGRMTNIHAAKKFEKQTGNLNTGLIMADKQLRKESLSYILQHPIRHMLMAVPIALRSMQVIMGFEMHLPRHRYPNNVTIPSIFGIIYFLPLFFVLVLALNRTDIALFGLLLPAFFLWLTTAMLTHGLARYNEPALPLLTIALLLFVADGISRFKKYWNAKKDKQAAAS